MPDARTSARAILTEDVLALCLRAGERESFALRELAAGVAGFAAELPRPPSAPEGLSRLTARALGSLGQPRSARRVLLVGSGLARPDDWLVSGRGAAWTLDCRALLKRRDDRLELAFFLGLDTVLDALAGLWDPTAGHGLLGLRHTAGAGRLLLGSFAPRPRIAAFRREARLACERRLERLCAGRRWETRPQVLYVDPETP